MNQIYNIHSQNLFIEVPVNNETKIKLAVLNWIQLLEEPFYVVGLTFQENPNNDPYNGGSSEWVVKRDSIVGFKAVCCNLYWTKEQDDKINEVNAVWDVDPPVGDNVQLC